jgi:hypothetical protein
VFRKAVDIRGKNLMVLFQVLPSSSTVMCFMNLDLFVHLLQAIELGLCGKT